MKHKHGWASVVCCFVLFIVVCLSLTMHVQGAFRAAGHPEIGLLFLRCPVRWPVLFSPARGDPTADRGDAGGAVLLVLMRVVFMPTRSFWQELAWLFSAVFWCALGALCYLFISSLFSHRRKTPIAPSGRGRCQSNQAKRFRFSFAHASKSVQPPICF
ncbi:inner membrane protein YbjM [Salmonella enterica subsp. enterica serovar Worthington]|nr:inner membrane protein YbjM [Salmonella enterica subsp. enterica serovar Worthington]